MGDMDTNGQSLASSPDTLREIVINQTYEDLRQRFKDRILYGKVINLEDAREVAVMAALWLDCADDWSASTV
jgi:hypothetical protein